jgi:hypothetical protein
MFNLGHQEFPNTNESRPRGDFVAEGFSNGGRGEWHAGIVEIEELLKVEELALRGFGAEIPFFVSRGSDLGFKHEVEGDGRFEESSGLWVSNVFFFNDSGELVSPETVNL